MKSKYSDCNVISVRFENSQVKAINALALALSLPRNTVIRRLFSMILADVDAGRKIF